MSLPAVDFPPVPDRHDHDYDLIVMDHVEDAIVSHAEPDDPGVTFERLDSGRAWVVLEGEEPSIDSALNVSGKGEECPFRRGREDDPVAGHYASPAFRRTSS